MDVRLTIVANFTPKDLKKKIGRVDFEPHIFTLFDSFLLIAILATVLDLKGAPIRQKQLS